MNLILFPAHLLSEAVFVLYLIFFDVFFDLLLRREFYENIIIGLVGAGVLKVIDLSYKYASSLAFSYNHFTISGIWVAEFESYVPQKANIELLRITQRREAIFFYLEQYSNYTKTPRKFQGQGIFRGTELSAIYYALDRNIVQNGVLALRLVHSPADPSLMIGEYAEFVSTQEGSKIELGKGEYCLRKIDLPVTKKLKPLFHRQTFEGYASIRKYLKKLNLNQN